MLQQQHQSLEKFCDGEAIPVTPHVVIVSLQTEAALDTLHISTNGQDILRTFVVFNEDLFFQVNNTFEAIKICYENILAWPNLFGSGLGKTVPHVWQMIGYILGSDQKKITEYRCVGDVLNSIDPNRLVSRKEVE